MKIVIFIGTLTGVSPLWTKISWFVNEIRIVSRVSLIFSSKPPNKTLGSFFDSLDSSSLFEGFSGISASIIVIKVLKFQFFSGF